MKPLELTIYPHSKKHLNTNWLTFYEAPDGLMTAGRSGELPAGKHLTDAELAAEFEAARCDYLLIQHTGSVWTPLGETWLMNPQDAGNRVGTLHRFATAPHYYQEQE